MVAFRYSNICYITTQFFLLQKKILFLMCELCIWIVQNTSKNINNCLICFWVTGMDWCSLCQRLGLTRSVRNKPRVRSTSIERWRRKSPPEVKDEGKQVFCRRTLVHKSKAKPWQKARIDKLHTLSFLWILPIFIFMNSHGNAKTTHLKYVYIE